jgi:7,8-dihydropterin-6-yl-methyl-4-(beta-D-ribofuranosyl)aminobenzene 5'-phosphate synthase
MARCVRFNLLALPVETMIRGLKLRVVAENSASMDDPRIWAQHGLCLFMEADLGAECMRILSDTGTSPELTLHNADVLKLDLSELDLIFLSHGHYDHTGGLIGVLNRMNRRVPVLAHPEIFTPKLKSRPFLKFIGPPFSQAQAESAGAVMLYSKSSVVLAPGLMTTGEVGRREPFEMAEGFQTINHGQYSQDTIPDDQAIIANIEGKGLAVIAGCAHAGIINTIRHAQEITGVEDLYAVIGGFHLRGAGEARIASTAGALLGLDPKIVRPGHCTGARAVCHLVDVLGDRCRPMASGDFIEL